MNAQRHISHLRLGVAAMAVTATATAAAAFAAPAFAASTRYAAPTPAGTHNCKSRANACSISEAVGGAAAGDQVVLEPGDYGSPASPLTTSVATSAADVDIHGTDKRPRSPSAVIYSTAAYGLSVQGPGSELSDVEVDDAGNSNGAGLAFSGSLAQRLVVISGPDEAWGCDINGSAVLRDSVCEQQGSGDAIGVSGVLEGPNNVWLRNDTAISTSGDGIYVQSAGSRSSAATIINTIARGGHFDVEVFKQGSSATVTTRHSNYGATNLVDGATITDNGTSQKTGLQPVSQLFVDAATGDFREAIGAQTIAAGETSSPDGSTDLYGNRRTALGHACQTTDIGADEFQPAHTPTITTAAATTITRKAAVVSAAANPLGGTEVVYFEYGPAGPHGGAPTYAHRVSTAPQCTGPADTPVAVTAHLHGLRPGTKYYYRLVAANATGETAPSFTKTFTTRH